MQFWDDEAPKTIVTGIGAPSIACNPGERRYDMIEVKGPGDRLQDNQRRWLAFFHHHEMPVAVCYVRWADSAEPAP